MSEGLNLNLIKVEEDLLSDKVVFSNFFELKKYIENGVSYYKRFVYTVDNVDQAEADYETLKSVKNKLMKIKREMKNDFNRPIEEIQEQLDDLIDMVKEPLSYIEKVVKEKRNESKKIEILKYANEAAKVLGEYKDDLINNPKFFNSRWYNVSFTLSMIKREIKAKIEDAKSALKIIEESDTDKKVELRAYYFKDLSLDGTSQYLDMLKRAEAKKVENNISNDSVQVENTINTAKQTSTSIISNKDEDFDLIGYRLLKVYGTKKQMERLDKELDFLGITYEEIEKDFDENAYNSNVSKDAISNVDIENDNDDDDDDLPF